MVMCSFGRGQGNVHIFRSLVSEFNTSSLHTGTDLEGCLLNLGVTLDIFNWRRDIAYTLPLYLLPLLFVNRVVVNNLYTIQQFYNSTWTHILPKKQTMIIDYYLRIFNSTIQQLYNSTWTHMLPKNTNYDHWLLLAYIQFYNSTIIQFYMNTHVTKKHKLWSLTTSSVYSIQQFNNYTILRAHSRSIIIKQFNSTSRIAHKSGGWS